MSHYNCIFFLFPYISSDFCFTYLCFFVLRCLMVYDVYLLCELYPLSLKIFIFVSFKIKKMKIMSSLKQRKQIYNTVLLTYSHHAVHYIPRRTYLSHHWKFAPFEHPHPFHPLPSQPPICFLSQWVSDYCGVFWGGKLTQGFSDSTYK